MQLLAATSALDVLSLVSFASGESVCSSATASVFAAVLVAMLPLQITGWVDRFEAQRVFA